MDDTKKPGSRDISDLKARLGLKSSAPAAPPGAAPFPGAAPAFGGQPQAPPDPKRDPFAQQQAANLAAFYGIGQALPGSAEGVSTAGVTETTAWGKIALWLGFVAIGLVVGGAAGSIYASRVEFNRTIDQAGQIRTEVERLSKQLTTIADTLNASKETAKGLPDFELAKKLSELNLTKPDTQKLFHTNYAKLDDLVIDRLFNYYNRTIKLYDDLEQHNKRTQADRPAIESYMKNGAQKGDKLYGVTFDYSGPLPLAHMVEMGSPVCNDPSKTDCPAKELKGFKFRTGTGDAYQEKPIKGPPQNTIVPIEATELFKSVAAGNPDVLAFKDYLRRIIGIKAAAQQLVAEQKEVLADLKRAAEKPKVIAF